MEKNKLWMILIIALLVLMCAGFVLGFFFINKSLKTVQIQETGATVRNDNPSGKMNPANSDNVALGDPIISNLLSDDPKATPMIQISVHIMLDKTDVKAHTAFKEVLVGAGHDGGGQLDLAKSLVIDVLRDTNVSEASAQDGKTVLEEKVFQKLMDNFNSNIIVGVFFSDYKVSP